MSLAPHPVFHAQPAISRSDALMLRAGAAIVPAADRDATPFFEHKVPGVSRLGDAEVRAFVGSLAGSGTDATVFSPLIGAQLTAPAGSTIEVPLDPAFEHGILVDSGTVSVEGVAVPVAHLAYLCPGRSSLELVVGGTDARLLLLGGEPLGEQIVMWWNFIGRSHDDIVRSREEWQRDVIGGADRTARFGAVAGYDGSPLPAPVLPTVRLKPRG